MSVIHQRNSGTAAADPARTSGAVREAAACGVQRPAHPEEVDRFRALMLQRQAGAQPEARIESLLAQRADDAARVEAREFDDALKRKAYARDGEPQREPLSQDAALAAMAAALAPAAERPLPPQALEQAAAPRLAELLERHVRQLAVSPDARERDDGQVLLRMADATLPGTDLLLSRTADGWTLRADVRSRASYDAIREAAPELARRFAARNLGTLTIDPHLHG